MENRSIRVKSHLPIKRSNRLMGDQAVTYSINVSSSRCDPVTPDTHFEVIVYFCICLDLAVGDVKY